MCVSVFWERGVCDVLGGAWCGVVLGGRGVALFLVVWCGVCFF